MCQLSGVEIEEIRNMGEERVARFAESLGRDVLVVHHASAPRFSCIGGPVPHGICSPRSDDGEAMELAFQLDLAEMHACQVGRVDWPGMALPKHGALLFFFGSDYTAAVLHSPERRMLDQGIDVIPVEFRRETRYPSFFPCGWEEAGGDWATVFKRGPLPFISAARGAGILFGLPDSELPGSLRELHRLRTGSVTNSISLEEMARDWFCLLQLFEDPDVPFLSQGIVGMEFCIHAADLLRGNFARVYLNVCQL